MKLGMLCSAVLLASGDYSVVRGNNDSICPQRVRAVIQDVGRGDELTAIRVVYGGDCFEQGPYEYPCAEGVCEGPTERFEVTGPESYRWVSRGHGIWGEFRRVE